MPEVLHIPFHQPVVRDLAWVMLSPGLLGATPVGQRMVSDDCCLQIFLAAEPQLRALDENPSPLLQAVAQNKNHRLGAYFECLLAYWLENILRVQDFRQNVPLFDKEQEEGQEQNQSKGRRTLGEFDFLFRLAEKKPLQHWEATVKFYLLRRNQQGEGYWLGPGGRDRLDLKLDRMFQHQLSLAGRPQAEAVLGEAGGGSVEAAAFIKGYLFYPLDENGERKPMPKMTSAMSPYALSKHHLQGWWLRWRPGLLPGDGDESRWLVLPKSRWLSPARQSDDSGAMDANSADRFFEAHFRQNEAPLLVAELRLRAGLKEGAWEEVSRGFLLPPE